MLEALGPGTRLGYCTNVHAGHDLDSTLANLETHAAGVRRHLGVNELGIGLWLSAEAARAALARVDETRERIAAMGLRVFTLNGFPYYDFHDPVVKHRVYEPKWSDAARLNYTLTLIDVLHALLPRGEEGSISTLPLGWPTGWNKATDDELAVGFLQRVAVRLLDLEKTTGRVIHLDLEPEPGCLLRRADDVVRLFDDPLLRSDEARRHLRVCHDVCHSAVMFEAQEEAFATYKAAGIQVGKVQISSALKARGAAAGELRHFNEPRYLHQTCVKREGRINEYEDLPKALAARRADDAASEWRVHFHVPIHLTSVGALDTTQDEIRPAIRLALRHGVKHFEVETYAWTVLPDELKPADLAAGIADELRWAAETAA